MDKALQDYFDRNMGIYGICPLLMVMIEALGVLHEARHHDFLKENAEAKEGNDASKLAYAIPAEHLHHHLNFVEGLNSHAFVKSIFPQNTLVSLVSQFDVFVGRLVRFIYRQKPEMLRAIERQLTYAEISGMETIARVQEFIIEKEIESLLRSSHIDQIRWFENRCAVTLRADEKLIADFVEITQRRNLFVHSDGVVSEQYLSACRENRCDCTDIKAGAKLNVDQKYFTHAADRLLEVGFKLGQIVWRKLVPDERSKANLSLVMIPYKLIARKRYAAAIKLLEFFVHSQRDRIRDDRTEYMCILNLAQAYKWLGDDEKCRETLQLENWITKSDDFLLAYYVLSEQYEAMGKLMRKIGAERDGINKVAYQEWPIFSAAAETSEFRAAFREVYDEDYERKEISDVYTLPRQIEPVPSLEADAEAGQVSAPAEQPDPHVSSLGSESDG